MCISGKEAVVVLYLFEDEALQYGEAVQVVPLFAFKKPEANLQIDSAFAGWLKK